MSDESPNKSPFEPRPDEPFETYEVFHSCPNCGKTMDSAAKATGAEGGPEVDSLMVCYYCSYPSMVAQTTDLGVYLRDPTRKEWVDILSDEKLLMMFELLRRSRN